MFEEWNEIKVAVPGVVPIRDIENLKNENLDLFIVNSCSNRDIVKSFMTAAIDLKLPIWCEMHLNTDQILALLSEVKNSTSSATSLFAPFDIVYSSGFYRHYLKPKSLKL